VLSWQQSTAAKQHQTARFISLLPSNCDVGGTEADVAPVALAVKPRVPRARAKTALYIAASARFYIGIMATVTEARASLAMTWRADDRWSS